MSEFIFLENSQFCLKSMILFMKITWQLNDELDIRNGVHWSESFYPISLFFFLDYLFFYMNVANFAKCKFCSSYQYGKSTNGITFHFLKQRRQKGKIYIIFSIFLENITKICKQRIIFRFLGGKMVRLGFTGKD